MRRRVIVIAVFALLFGALFFALRGTNVSNALKKVILPELELATGKKVIARKVYINLLPLFIEIKGVKLFDDKGERILEIERAKGYLSLSGLLRRELPITRLVIKAPVLTTERSGLEEILAHVAKYLEKETKPPLKVVVESVEVNDGAVTLLDGGYRLGLKRLDGTVITGASPRCTLSVKDLSMSKEGLPEVSGRLETRFSVVKKRVEVKSLELASQGSTLNASGSFDTQAGAGSFEVDAGLALASVKKMFALKNSGEGEVAARGTVTLNSRKPALEGVALDLKLKGDFFLETLMELLKVTEPLKGRLQVKGEVKGTLADLNGMGKAGLTKGNIYNVLVDALTCAVSYENGQMRFTEGSARLYGGTGKAEAMIRLPKVTEYQVDVSVNGVSSKGLFTLIGWDPHLPPGLVSGELSTAGETFSPRGTFAYTGTAPGGDVLGRVKEVTGSFSMAGEVIQFDTLTVATALSSATAKGSVNLKGGALLFSGSGATKEISDLTAPYFTALSGPAAFSASLTGPSSNAVIEMNVKAPALTLATGKLGLAETLKSVLVPLEQVEAEATYRKNLLTVKRLQGRAAKGTVQASGGVAFPSAAALFELKSPDYALTLKAKDASLAEYGALVIGAPPLAGSGDLALEMRGTPESLHFSGELSARNVAVGADYTLDSVSGGVGYSKGEFHFDNVRLKKGGSLLVAGGSVATDRRFSFKASSERIAFPDAAPLTLKKALESGSKRLPEEDFFNALSFVNVKGKGEGTFDHPRIEVSSEVQGGFYRGHPLGKGDLKVGMLDKKVTLEARLLDRKLDIKGGLTLTGPMPWQVRADLQPARYDFIIANFLKEVPEDLLLTLKGSVAARGDRQHAEADIEIGKVHLSAFGTAFTNSLPLTATLEDRRLTLKNFSMRSDLSEFRGGGSMTFGKSFDLLLEGSLALAPLKALSKSIDTLRGSAAFVLAVAGDWNKPKINGSIDVTNGTLALKNLSYRLSSLAAYAYIDEDRIVLERASGKISGGEVSFFGTAYLQQFSIKRFFLESRLKGIDASPSKDFWVNLDGTLHYRGDLSSQTILGDISLKKAKYTERVEWKSWLLRARQKDRVKIEGSKFDATNLNLRVTGSNLTIDNNVSRAALRMDLLVRGTVGRPVLLGKVEAKEGIVYFRNNEFKILKATIDFSNPTQVHPYFDIVSETTAQGYNIRLSLDGYIEQFNLSLSSDPPLDETDIFSLLTVGQIGKNLKGLEGGIGAGEATSFLTGKLQDVIEDRLKTITGFDRVQIDPSISKSTGTISPRVTIAKRLLGDRLYVTYSTAVSTGEEQIWKLEYLLGKNTSLLGVRDERGSLGGDVKFRFEFK